MGSRKKASRKLSGKAVPEIAFKNLYVKVRGTQLEYIIPLQEVYSLDVDGNEVAQILYQKPYKKYHHKLQVYQAVPKGKKYVINKEYFKQSYWSIKFQDAFHLEYFKEENSKRGGA